MSRTLTLADGGVALGLALPARGMPEILAFGPADGASEWLAGRASRINGMDEAVPSAVLLPCGGMGFFGWPAIAGHRDGRQAVLQFADWQAEGSGGGCRLRAGDRVAEVDLVIDLELADGVLRSQTCLTNRGQDDYTLDRCMAGSLLFPEGPAAVTSFTGMWGREFRLRRTPLGADLWLRESRRGRTSHDRFPGAVLDGGGATLAVHLGWSGNHCLCVDTLDDGRRLVHAGELFEPGEMRLAPGAHYASPAAYFATTAEAMVAQARRLLPWPGGAMAPRPVTLNTWEGNYFALSEPALFAQARAAAELGIERFVVDDGWFGVRDDDRTGLGDWWVDRRKFPRGLRPLADHVHGLGMQFGLWVEPEMASPASDLLRAHPDWALRIAGRPPLTSRHQLVLDLARPEVAEHVFAALDQLLGATPIDCLKWDMNRDLAPAADQAGRPAAARQTRAVYALLDRLRQAHPQLEIEACASGGGRADYGMLGRSHRIWTSDCTDALERLEIQRGARQFFPPEILGAHVSGVPNHQTGRDLSLTFRALVALAYHFGVELDPLALAPAEQAVLAGWIALHKRLRPLLHRPGAAFHLPPVDGRYAWGAAGPDAMALIVAQGQAMVAEQPPPLRLPAAWLAEGRWRIAACHPAMPEFYRISEEQRQLLAGVTTASRYGLCAQGLPLPMLRPESGLVLELQRVART